MIPAAKKSDHEDVAWALSTAEAQWSRGERGEAIKWLRRAAEAASEVDDDTRALELAKAVAELTASTPPPAPSTPPKAVEVPPQAAAPKSTSGAPRPPASVPPRSNAPRPLIGTGKPKAPSAPVKRGGRKSIPPEGATALRGQPQKEDDKTIRSLGRGESTDTDLVASPAKLDDTTPHPPSTKDPHSQVPTMPPAGSAVAASDADAWPTEAMSGQDLPNFEHERTRVGGEPYQPPEPTVVATNVAAPPPPGEKLAASQAVRVIVWRDANGVHVAPAGTTVTAITVDAMLVAMDTTADLSAWLNKK